MRELTDASRLQRFMRELARAARGAANVYLTGGASAVLLGWRATTLDVDLKLVPEGDELLRAIARLKDELRLNVELAAPDQFLPALPQWRERSVFIARHDPLSFFHYDFYAQALAKIEREHPQDRLDVGSMRAGGLIRRDQLLELFAAIEPELYRFPAVDAKDLRRRLDELVSGASWAET
jgi:hypothetical protein